MTREEFDELQGRANDAALLSESIALLENELERNGAIFDIYHNPVCFLGRSKYLKEGAGKINDMIRDLAKKEYGLLLNELKARFSEM